MIEIDIQLFPCHPKRKLLVPINQSSYLISFWYNFFDRAEEANTYEIKPRRLHSQILTSFIFLVLFLKKINVSLKKATLQENVIVVEKLDCIDMDVDIDDIVNLEDSTRLVFIDEECRNLIVVMILENLL